VPGAGWLDLTVTVPPGVGCNSVYLQQFAFDPGVGANASMTNGLEIYFTD